MLRIWSMVGSFGDITFLLLRSSIFARRPSLRLGTLCSVALAMTAFQSLFALPGGQLRSDSVVLGTRGTAPVKGFRRRPMRQFGYGGRAGDLATCRFRAWLDI